MDGSALPRSDVVYPGVRCGTLGLGGEVPAVALVGEVPKLDVLFPGWGLDTSSARDNLQPLNSHLKSQLRDTPGGDLPFSSGFTVISMSYAQRVVTRMALRETHSRIHHHLRLPLPHCLLVNCYLGFALDIVFLSFHRKNRLLSAGGPPDRV